MLLNSQMMLTLPGEVTFDRLRTLISEQTTVPPERQKLRTGFPPKELKQPENNDEIVPLNHGDKISVEIIPDRTVPMETDSKIPSGDFHKVSEVSHGNRSARSWSSFDEDAVGNTEDVLLRALKGAEGG